MKKQSFVPKPPRMTEADRLAAAIKAGEVIPMPQGGAPGGAHLPAERDIPLGMVLRASRLNDLAVAFGVEAQVLSTEAQREDLISEARFAGLKFHPRFRRYFPYPK